MCVMLAQEPAGAVPARGDAAVRAEGDGWPGDTLRSCPSAGCIRQGFQRRRKFVINFCISFGFLFLYIMESILIIPYTLEKRI